MRTLIIGGSGLLGKALLETRSDTDLHLTFHRNYLISDDPAATWYSLDVRSRPDVRHLFNRIKPHVVIHCAAIGSVDYAADHYNETFATNYYGTKHVTDAANEYGTKVIYISTNAVYSGKNPPYDEQSPLEAINEYGAIKIQTEHYVKQIANNWLIIRPFLLYGVPYAGGRTNWAKMIIQRLRTGESLKLVNDCIWQPTYSTDCASAIWKLLHYNKQIFNVASPECATLYEFGQKVCKVFDLDDQLLVAVGSDFFTSLAKRPKDTTYDLVKLSEAGVMLSDIETGLTKMKETYV